uniref:UBA domain-containing protein n=1 Tax=Ditylenchus dipsaci TaxID=166011 RepID=A0A915EPK3_9BILA
MLQSPMICFSKLSNVFTGMGIPAVQHNTGNPSSETGSSASQRMQQAPDDQVQQAEPMEVDYSNLRQNYQTQLEQMREFGFTNDEENLRALQACDGVVEAALELSLRCAFMQLDPVYGFDSNALVSNSNMDSESEDDDEDNVLDLCCRSSNSAKIESTTDLAQRVDSSLVLFGVAFYLFYYAASVTPSSPTVNPASSGSFNFSKANSIINTLCAGVARGEHAGDSCNWLCFKKNYSILDFYEGGSKKVLKISENGKDVILKMDHAYASDYEYVDPRVEDEEFTDKVLEIVNDQLHLNWPAKYKSHLLRKLWPSSSTQQYRNHSLSEGERNSLWALLQQEEFINFRILPLSRITPKILGTCGHAYQVEYLIPFKMKAYYMNLKAKILVHLMGTLKLFYEFLNDPLQWCDVKFENLGLSAEYPKRFVVMDSDMIYTETKLNTMLTSRSCATDDQCHFFDCHSRCDNSTGFCTERINDNVDVFCQKLVNRLLVPFGQNPTNIWLPVMNHRFKMVQMGSEIQDNSVVVNNAVKQIVEDKNLTLVSYVESLRERLTSKDASIREVAINELVEVLMKIPGDQLDGQTSNFLLEFLLLRVEDSGHLADLLVTGIHYLIMHNGRNLPNGAVESIMGILFEESGVQSYGQKDRMLLFLILEYLLNTHLDGLKLSVSDKMVVLFMRAANSERDPRCLLKIFQLFNLVVRNFPMGALAEDMFEQVACYYPIDYEPNERDVGKLSKEMLSLGCESCLLAHQSFGPFCFQLIAEKLVEDPGDGGEAHLNNSLRSVHFWEKLLEDLLTAFRLICLNPAQTKTSLKTTSNVLGTTLKTVALNLKQCSESAEEDLCFMAEITVEHCEPFVLQAEMGLTTKALNLLEAIANSNEMAKRIVVERVLYWLNTLMAGITVKSPENRKEISEETIECLPTWIRLAKQVEKTDTNQLILKRAFIDMFAKMKALEEFCDDEKLVAARYECGTALAQDMLSSTTQQTISNDEMLSANTELSSVCEKLMVDAFIQNCSILNEEVKNFIATYSKTNFEKCRQLLSTSAVNLENIVSSSTANDKLCGLIGALIQDQESFKWASPLMFNCVQKSGTSDNSCKEISSVIARKDNVADEQIQRLAYLLQDVGLQLDLKTHDALTTWILASAESSTQTDVISKMSYLLFLQSKSTNLLEKIIPFVLSCPNLDESIFLALLFALVNRRKGESVHKFRSSIESSIKHPIRLKVWEARAYLLLDAKKGIHKVEELFEQFSSGLTQEVMQLGEYLSVDLLDFDSPWADPQKCGYECTMLWRQRVMCQCVPVYVNFFDQIPSEQTEKRVCLLKLVEPLLKLAKSVPIPMVAELKMITPMFTAALPASLDQKNSKAGTDVTLLLDGSLQLLQMTSMEELSDTSLNIFISSFLNVLQQQHQPMNIILQAGSKKRVIRQKSAYVRNTWELVLG